MSEPGALLAERWGITGRVRPLGGGMNSDTWLVDHAGATYVVKHVPPAGVEGLTAGSRVAARLADAGLVTGRPVPDRDGRLVATAADGSAIALLEQVRGRELTGDPEQEQVWMAEVLARVHASTAPAPGPATAAFATNWRSPDAPGVADHGWLVAAIAGVRAETDPLVLTWAVLHADPAPEAFVHDDETGVTALIDWAGSTRGPALYDVASAVMYLGGSEHASAFLDAYRATGPLSDGEIRHLDAFRRLREVVQGVYFAGRLAADDLTGGVGREDNEKGLSDARRRLAALGVRT